MPGRKFGPTESGGVAARRAKREQEAKAAQDTASTPK